MMLNFALREAGPGHGARLLDALVALVAETVDERVGLDAQAANWAVDGAALVDARRLHAAHARAEGSDQLDLALFLSIYPWALRAAAPGRPRASWRSTTIRARFSSTWPRTWSRSASTAGFPRSSRRPTSASRPPITERRGAALLRARPAPLAADAVAAPGRPRVAAPGAPPPLPVPAAPALPLRPPGATRRRSNHDRHAQTLPATNAEAFELIARHLSPHKAAATRPSVCDLVQGRREGVRSGTWRAATTSTAAARAASSTSATTPAFAVEALTARCAEHDMGDWLLPSARRAQGAAALARLLPEPLRYTLLHGLGRRGRRGGVQARTLGDRAARVRVRRARLPRTRRVLARHGRPPLSDRYRPLTPGIMRVPFGDLDALRAGDRRRHSGRDHGDDPGHRRLPGAARGLLRRDAPALRRARRAADPRRGPGRPRRTGRLWAFEHFGVVPDVLIDRQGHERRRLPDRGLLLRRSRRGALRRGPLLPPLELRRVGARRAGGRGRGRAL